MVITILLVVWLFKVKNNAKEEPADRNLYVQEDIFETKYEVGDFCYDNYNPYITNGAFKQFNIKMKNIKKYSTALLSMLIISLILSVLFIFFAILYKICCSTHQTCGGVLLMIYLFINFIRNILSLVFFIILSVNYFRCDFDNFEDFSECKYLHKAFQNDYHFVFVVKNTYIKCFILYLVSMLLDCFEICLNIFSKKKK